MKQLIQDIINKFGGRLPASTQEREAQLYLMSLLEKFCNSITVHEFSVPVKSMFGSLKIFCSLYYASLVLFYFNPAAAFALSLLNTIVYLGHFVTYHFWLDFLFPKQKSLNITGVIEPAETATSTVIVSGHMDSTLEFIWWYRLKHYGMVLSIVSGFLIALFPLVAGLGWLQQLFAFSFPIADYLWWANVVASPITIVLFSIHGKNMILGAQDNLSGVVIATEVGKHFATHRLKNTRLKVVSFGCEEPGLRGSTAYAKDLTKQLKNEHAVCINIDGVKDADKLTIITAEPMVLARCTPYMVDRLENSFKHLSIPCLKRIVPVGATDGVSFIRQDIPTVSIIGQSTEKLDPTYHTRLDVPDCVDEKALEDTKNVVVEFIRRWDEKNEVGF